VAVVTDREDAPLVLLHSYTGDPPPKAPGPGELLWVDLWTRDPAAAARFYESLADLHVRTAKRPNGMTKQVLARGDVVTGGLIALPWTDVRANWLPYIRVDDVASTAARAKQLGGVVVVQTSDTAILRDPEGAAIGIQSGRAEGSSQ